MYTQKQLTEQVRALGVCPTDTLTVHTSLKAVGELECGALTGADVFIAALRDSVLEGLLVIPTLTYANIRETPVFDIRRTMPCIGTVPCVAVEMANRAYDAGDVTCVRSMQVSHSVVAFGRDAYPFTECDRETSTRNPPEGCYGELYRRGGKILLVGVDLTRCTYIHMVDECIDSTPHGTVTITVTDYDGTVFEKERILTTGPAASTFGIYEEPLREAGGIVYGKVGDADAMLVDARICYDVVMRIRGGA